MHDLLVFIGRTESFYYYAFILTVQLLTAAAWYVSVDNKLLRSNLLHRSWMKAYFAVGCIGLATHLLPFTAKSEVIALSQLFTYLCGSGLLLLACVAWLRTTLGISVVALVHASVLLGALTTGNTLLYAIALQSLLVYSTLLIVMTTAFLRNRHIGYLFLLLACLSVVVGAGYQAVMIQQGYLQIAIDLITAYSICGFCLVGAGYILVVQYREQRILERLALHDPLTSLLNRRGMDEAFSSASAEPLQPWCVAAIDIDFFKKINDHYGHDVGDIVIKGVSDVLRAQVRSQDILCRYGGEEFVFLLLNTPLQAGRAIAERLRSDVAATIFQDAAAQIRVTVSIGLAAGDHKTFLQERIKTADKALYQAKAQGRNCVVTDSRET